VGVCSGFRMCVWGGGVSKELGKYGHSEWREKGAGITGWRQKNKNNKRR